MGYDRFIDSRIEKKFSFWLNCFQVKEIAEKMGYSFFLTNVYYFYVSSKYFLIDDLGANL